MTKPFTPHYVRIQKAAQVYGISARTIYRWAERGLVSLTKHDAMTFVDHAELAATIAGKPKGGRTK